MRVLSSASAPGPGSNPYLTLLQRSLEPSVEVAWFTWPRALAGRYDVLHLHWPEVKLRGRTPTRTAARWALFALLLVRLKLGRRALVRTLHNTAPHEPLQLPARALLRRCERWTTAWIALNPTTRPPGEAPVTVIPHGHYRDWVAEHPRAEVRPGRVLNVGLLRRYKGVEELLSAFAEMPGDEVELRVVGAPADPGVADAVRAAAVHDPRIALEARYVSEAELVLEISAAELVVLPHAGAGNSGALLMALSIDRPVLVPSGPVSDALAVEVGRGWVQTYTGRLTGACLADALAVARALDGAPALGARDWPAQAASHTEVFEAAVTRVRRGRSAVATRLRRAGGLGEGSPAGPSSAPQRREVR